MAGPPSPELEEGAETEVTGPNSSNTGWYRWPDEFYSPDGLRLRPITVEYEHETDLTPPDDV
jgi:hypothetical protein